MTQDAFLFRDDGSSTGPAHGMAADGRGSGQGGPAASAPEAGAPPQDFVDALLAALTQMAALSLRRQADVAVAMRRAGLACAAEGVAAALEMLRRDGCIEAPLHLSDGGILVSVTARGIERLAATSHRHVVAGLMARTGG